ncbi:MAG TPA: 50S ribosomal protein L20 [Candidatus Paceibacterota bacterium]
MTRVKKAINARKYRRNILRMTKGYRHARKSKERAAQEAVFHAGTYAFAHRRDKKGDFRRLWNVRINAALRPLGFSYSKFIDALKKNKIALDRKILADLATENPETFKKIVEKVYPVK